MHLHLEQRVAQRLLARFRAQGFIHHDLSRACLAQVARLDPARHPARPAVAVRPAAPSGCTRNWSPVAARWVEPAQRDGPLQRLRARRRGADASSCSTGARAARARTSRRARSRAQLLDSGAARRRGAAAAARAARRGARGRGRSRSSRERGRARESDLRETLERQRDRVREELDTPRGASSQQLTLGFADEERRQLEAEHALLGARLAQFDRDLEREPQRIARLLRGARDARRAGRARLPVAGHELMAGASRSRRSLAHLEWLGFVQPTGLVVSAAGARPRGSDPRPRAIATASGSCASASRSARSNRAASPSR